jgi:hypothetical protein
MSRPFILPQVYQGIANGLPGVMDRSQQVFAGGQNEHIAAPWDAVATGMQSNYRIDEHGHFIPSAYNPVQTMVRGYAQGADMFAREVQGARQVSLGRLGATSDGKPWYENMLVLGAGAAVIVGAVWFLTRK